jgi:hypothetical protein
VRDGLQARGSRGGAQARCVGKHTVPAAVGSLPTAVGRYVVSLTDKLHPRFLAGAFHTRHGGTRGVLMTVTA